jgi:hypothetical protein
MDLAREAFAVKVWARAFGTLDLFGVLIFSFSRSPFLSLFFVVHRAVHLRFFSCEKVAAILAESQADAASVVAALLADAYDSASAAAGDDGGGPSPDEVTLVQLLVLSFILFFLFSSLKVSLSSSFFSLVTITERARLHKPSASQFFLASLTQRRARAYRTLPQAAFLCANFGPAVASLVAQRRALLGQVDDVGQPAARLARLLQVATPRALA